MLSAARCCTTTFVHCNIKLWVFTLGYNSNPDDSYYFIQLDIIKLYKHIM